MKTKNRVNNKIALTFAKIDSIQKPMNDECGLPFIIRFEGQFYHSLLFMASFYAGGTPSSK